MQSIPYICRSCRANLAKSWHHSLNPAPTRRGFSTSRRRKQSVVQAAIAEGTAGNEVEIASRLRDVTRGQRKRKQERIGGVVEEPEQQKRSFRKVDGYNPNDAHRPAPKSRDTTLKGSEARRTAGQWAYLSNTAQPADLPRFRRQFWQWKAKLQTRLRGGDGPANVTKSPVLEQILEAHDPKGMWNMYKDLAKGDGRGTMSLIPLLLNCLLASPQYAHVLLDAFYDPQEMPSFVVEDSYTIFVHRLRNMKGKGQRHYAKQLANILGAILKRSPPKTVRLGQGEIHALLTALAGEVKGRHGRIYEQLVKHDARMHAHTRLHFAKHFAKDPETLPLAKTILEGVLTQEYGSYNPEALLQFIGIFAQNVEDKGLALLILKDLCERQQLNINSNRGLSLCSALLVFKSKKQPGDNSKEQSASADNDQLSSATIFQQLLDLGLVPNLITYTIVIDKLCNEHNMESAWRVYQIMIDHGIRPDGHLYSVLIHGCKLASDWTMLRTVVEKVIDARLWDPVIWNDVLHAIALSCREEARGLRNRDAGSTSLRSGFRVMLKLFSRVYHTDTSKHLITVETRIPDKTFGKQWLDLLDGLSSVSVRKRMQPTSATLTIMIYAYLRSLTNPYDILLFYSKFRKLLAEGDKVVCKLVEEEGTIIHDLVMHALVQTKGMLRMALDVVGDMLKDAPSDPPATSRVQGDNSQPTIDTASGSIAERASDPPPELSSTESSPDLSKPLHPQPSIHTWSILLNGFMLNEMFDEAESILSMMQQHHVKPSLVTWNTLAAGYARAQDTERTVYALQRLEAAGHKSDERSLRAFGYLQHKGQAISFMEQLVEQRRLQAEKAEKAEKKRAQLSLGAVSTITSLTSQDSTGEQSELAPEMLSAADELALDDEDDYDGGSSEAIDDLMEPEALGLPDTVEVVLRNREPSTFESKQRVRPTKKAVKRRKAAKVGQGEGGGGGNATDDA